MLFKLKGTVIGLKQSAVPAKLGYSMFCTKILILMHAFPLFIKYDQRLSVFFREIRVLFFIIQPKKSLFHWPFSLVCCCIYESGAKYSSFF